jgi:hypothetical protein
MISRMYANKSPTHSNQSPTSQGYRVYTSLDKSENPRNPPNPLKKGE